MGGLWHISRLRTTTEMALAVKPMKITASIARKHQEKFSLMTTVSNTPDMAWRKVTVSTRHRGS
jgi:hypothetical protein